MSTVQDAINELHFHPKWFEFGFLDSSFFEQQLQLWRHSEDTFWDYLEHHRYSAFKAFLDSKTGLSDAQMWQYVELCQLDEDGVMGLSALLNLVQWHGLTEDQFDALAGHSACANPTAQKVINRIRKHSELEAALSHEIIPNEVIAEVLEGRDSSLQRALVETPNLSRFQLELLAAQGTNRTIRNIAKNRLRRRA